MNQNSAAPTAKVAAVGVAGAITLILVWVAGMAGLEVPPEVASAVTLLIAAGAGYFTPSRSTARHLEEN